MATYLITGASGFFGKSLLRALLQTRTEDQFICLYHSTMYNIDDARFTWVKADLLDLSMHKYIIEHYKPTHCVHLAWHVPPQNFWYAEENIEWLRVSTNLFKEFCEGGGKFFMGSGTLAEYDWSTGTLDEDKTILVPHSLYGQCKKSLHEILEVIRNTRYTDTALLWARIGYFFGEDEPAQKLITKVIQSLQTNKTLNLVGQDMIRPYAHVNYLGKALAHILLNYKKDLTFNISAAKGYTLKAIVDYIRNELQATEAVVHYNSYVGLIPEPLTINVSTNRLEKALGASIPDTFFEDIRQIIEASNVKI